MLKMFKEILKVIFIIPYIIIFIITVLAIEIGETSTTIWSWLSED